MTCEAQVELSTELELHDKLRNGKRLTVTFINLQNQAYALASGSDRFRQGL